MCEEEKHSIIVSSIHEYEQDRAYRNVSWLDFLKNRNLTAGYYMFVYQKLIIRELIDKLGSYISSIIKLNSIDNDQSYPFIRFIVVLYNNYIFEIEWKGSGFTVGWNDGRWEVTVYKDNNIILPDPDTEKGMRIDDITHIVGRYCWKI